MKKLYITGMAGMLGINLAYCLKDRYQIIGADRVALKAMAGVTVQQYDLTDLALLEHHLAAASPDILIHTAAAVNVDVCEDDPQFARRINADLTHNLAVVCDRLGIRMIYISTDAVFDGESNKLYRETDLTAPVNVYGQTKLEGEHAVAAHGGLILRTNIYGYNCQDKRSFGEMILYGLQSGETLRMFDDIRFSPILVTDLAEIIHLCIVSDLTGLYHACGTGSISKYDFGCAFKDIFGLQSGSIVRSQSSQHNFRARRSHNMGMDNTKLRTALGIDIPSLLESIQRFRQQYDGKYPQLLKQFGEV